MLYITSLVLYVPFNHLPLTPPFPLLGHFDSGNHKSDLFLYGLFFIFDFDFLDSKYKRSYSICLYLIYFT